MSYQGPHSSFSVTHEPKIEDFYVNSQVEHLDHKNNDTTSVDAKFKHSKGFVRSKLHFSTPYDKTANEYRLNVNHDSQGRVDWNNMRTFFEFKGTTMRKEVDFGSHGFADNRLWINPYYGWNSNTDFSSNSLRVGGVFRYKELMWRAQVRLNKLLESGNTLGSVSVDQKGHFQKDEFNVQWFLAANASNQSVEKWNLLFGYENNRFGALAHASQDRAASTNLNCGSYLIYKHESALSAALKYTCTTTYSQKAEAKEGQANTEAAGSQSYNHRVQAGIQYVADKDTTCRWTGDNNWMAHFHLNHRWNQNLNILLNFQTNLRCMINAQPLPSGRGYMGYPFNYGLVFKVNA